LKRGNYSDEEYSFLNYSWFVGYPELATEPGPYQVETRWGVMKPTMDPTKKSTYTFLDSFFKEMTELFPDPYFHIGGDEVEGSQWTNSPSILKFINEHQLKDKNGLQAYFNRRIQTMLKKYDKIMIGWEEILDEVSGNLAVDKDAIIQSWKSRKSLANAIGKGYRTLLSSGYYLDHLLPSITHHKIDPILNDELWLFNEQQSSQILGGEACMWAEYVSENSVDSRIWPRLLAIAERFWSPSSINNQSFLYERLFRMSHLLDKIQTGVTHLSSYKLQLQNLIIDSNKKTSLLHPFVILADACEARGFDQRSVNVRYSSTVPLTTFTDALQPESELIWKLENLPINDKKFREIFRTWSINHVRLQSLFDDVDRSRNKELWGQNVEQLSRNLAQIGLIGLRILDYGTKRILHHEKNNTMNSWSLIQWIGHHNQLLEQIENQVEEVRLAAVRPVRRLINSLELISV
jgi:hexosaminidase